MQSVRLKKSFTFPRLASRSSWTRQFPSFLGALVMAVGMVPWAAPCLAQDTQAVPAAPQAKQRFDVGAGGFYQVTNASNGNFLREDTTESGGFLGSFRQHYRPWLSYEANIGYTKFYEAYNKGVVKVEDNVTDVSFAYLLQSPLIYGFQPFVSVGGGIIVFSPINGTLTDELGTLPTKLSSQLLPEFTYTLGINYPLFTRFGVRGQLRGLEYKTPDFHQNQLDTHTLRTTLEPALSVYYRF
jgi:Outer membrane protein beta-barrel domain